MANEHNRSELEHARVVAIYDLADGKIVHVHYCAADSETELPDKTMLEQQAYDHAARHNAIGDVSRTKLSFLHIDPTTYRMDTL